MHQLQSVEPPIYDEGMTRTLCAYNIDVIWILVESPRSLDHHGGIVVRL